MGLKSSESAKIRRSPGILSVVLLVLAVLVLLFRNNFLPGHTLFSNDGPLGTLMSQSHRLPEVYTGGWQDLNTIGFREGGGMPSITYTLLLLLGPVGFSKFYAPIALLILGFGAWCFFRQLRLAPLACVLGGLAAMLNSTFFSVATWGVASHTITAAMAFLALAALVDTSSRRRWVRLAMAGLALGMAVTEGADVGAIYSVYVAAFVMYQAWITEGPRARNLAVGVGRVAVVAVFAAFLAAQALSALIATQIQGVAGVQQDNQTKEERWDYATQWSLPKREALGLLIPGLFGYRMDTPQGLPEFLQEHYKGGNYWGAAGRDPAWYRYYANGKQGQPPAGPLRFTGGGNYDGVLVALVAVWAVLQALRKRDSVFSAANRPWVGFWFGAAAISLPLAFGRFAPFYRLLYALPYVSTIRNPAKFLAPFNLAVVVLFAYGMHALWKRYLEPGESDSAGILQTFKAWWARVRGFDRRWTLGCLGALGGSVLGCLMYASGREGLQKYLQEVGFDPEMSSAIARFSIGEVGWFIVFLAVAVGLVTLVLSGALSGRRARWGAALLGLFLVVDLGRANQPWIITWDYEQKYASNPIIDLLRQKPYEHRVAILPRYFSDPGFVEALGLPRQLAETEQYFAQGIYGIEWAQHHFLYYNVQSLDLVQMPRMPQDLMAFEVAMQPRKMEELPNLLVRRWQLTNTRYLLGAVGFLDFLNQQIDPGQHRFRIVERFSMVPKPGITRPTRMEEMTAQPATNGNFALFEFTGVLPRAKLYTNWQVSTNDQATLDQLRSSAFAPEKTVLVAEAVPSPTSAASSEPGAEKVEFASYAPKDIVLKTESSSGTVLLLNDRFDPNWKVLVDGKAEKLLRCNYLMRGVSLPKGNHTVQFRFEPPIGGFYVSLAAIVVGVLLCGLLLVLKAPPRPEDTPSGPAAPINRGKPEKSGAGNGSIPKKGSQPAGQAKK
jgi:hypothetical protein